MTSTKQANIAQLLVEAKDGDMVRLTLRENNVPRIIESFVRGSYVQITLGLEKVPIRPAYGMGESSLIQSIVGYYGQHFGEEGEQKILLYPLSQEILAVNSSPPIRIEVPLVEIESYILIKGERSVTPPRAFP